MTRLLIGYDGSDSARAAIAAAGALFGDAETVVANVHPAPLRPEDGAMARIALPSDVIRPGLEELARQTLDAARETAEEGAALAGAAGLRASPVTLTGSRPWRALLAAAGDADVLVCGTRGRGPIERTALGSTASSLVHHTQVPLLVVPAGARDLDGALLAGYDGSAGARAALSFAAEHLRERRLIVACAWRSPVRHSTRGRALMHSSIEMLRDYAGGIDDVWREVAEETADAGATLARDAGLQAQSRGAESDRGDAGGLIEAARATGAVAVLVGSRGRGPVAATVLGSVTSGLVGAGELPVLVVPAAA